MPSEPGDGPTAVRMLIGSQLRRLREERGLTRAEASDRIRASESKISRMEDVEVYYDAVNQPVVEAAEPAETIKILRRTIQDLYPAQR